MQNPIIIFLANISRWGVGLVFLLAGFSKIINPEDFMRVIANYNVLPQFLIPLTAIVLPWLEFISGLCLISKRFVKSAAALIALFLILFIIAMTINIIKDVQTDCGCFGLLFGDSKIGSFSVFRNTLLLSLTFFVFFFSRSVSEYGQKETGRFGAFLLLKSSFILFGIITILLFFSMLYTMNTLGENYIESRINLSRTISESQSYKSQLANYELEKQLLGRSIPTVYQQQYLKRKKTLLFLATSQDCSPCTESELNLWKEFLKNSKIDFNILCLYYRYNENQYGKYEDVYKSVFPFMYDKDKLYEHLKINDTPIALLFDSEGTIINAHRPDVLHPEKTKMFLKTLSQGE